MASENTQAYLCCTQLSIKYLDRTIPTVLGKSPQSVVAPHNLLVWSRSLLYILYTYTPIPRRTTSIKNSLGNFIPFRDSLEKITAHSDIQHLQSSFALLPDVRLMLTPATLRPLGGGVWQGLICTISLTSDSSNDYKQNNFILDLLCKFAEVTVFRTDVRIAATLLQRASMLTSLCCKRTRITPGQILSLTYFLLTLEEFFSPPADEMLQRFSLWGDENEQTEKGREGGITVTPQSERHRCPVSESALMTTPRVWRPSNTKVEPGNKCHNATETDHMGSVLWGKLRLQWWPGIHNWIYYQL